MYCQDYFEDKIFLPHFPHKFPRASDLLFFLHLLNLFFCVSRILHQQKLENNCHREPELVEGVAIPLGIASFSPSAKSSQ